MAKKNVFNTMNKLVKQTFKITKQSIKVVKQAKQFADKLNESATQ